MTTDDDENLKPSEVSDPPLDELLSEVLGLIDEVVATRLAGGELARRRARIKAGADREAPDRPAPGCSCGHAVPPGLDLPAIVPASAGAWPDDLQVELVARRTLINTAERDADEIRAAAHQTAEDYQDAALKRAAETVAAARQDAEHILAAARQEANRILAAAEAEREQTPVTARREAVDPFEGAPAALTQSTRPTAFSGAALTNNRLEGLTARQRQILALYAEGHSNLAIAQKLNMGVGHVEKYLTQIMRTLGLPTGDDPHWSTTWCPQPDVELPARRHHP